MLAVVSDRKLQVAANWSTARVYAPDVLSYTDYYAFGWEMPGRSSGSYRYGFNGQEQETELLGGVEGFFSAEFWMYDSRSGRRWNVDPVVDHSLSPYATFACNPIFFSDISGAAPTGNGNGNGVPENQDGTTETVEITAQGSHADPLWKNFIQGFVGDGTNWNNYIQSIADRNLKPHQTEFARAIYGSNPDGSVAVPEEFRVQAMADALKTALPSLKKAWAQNRMPACVPCAEALTVGSREEGYALVTDVSISVASAWILHVAGGGIGPRSGGETVYRSMSNEAAETFISTGKMPPGSETFVSPSRAYAAQYDGVLFKINLNSGTMSRLESIGVRNASAAHPYEHLPLVQKGWKSNNAFFKLEDPHVNVGLGNGKALGIFNSNIQSFEILPK